MQSVATTLNVKATYSEKPVAFNSPLEDFFNLPELETSLERADVRDNLLSDVLNYHQLSTASFTCKHYRVQHFNSAHKIYLEVCSFYFFLNYFFNNKFTAHLKRNSLY